MTEQQCECDPLDHGLDCPLRMTEQHECKWGVMKISMAVCVGDDEHCREVLHHDEIERRLNEYEPLKKATDALKPAWVCEFCFSCLLEGDLPADWGLVFLSAVCPSCQKKVAQDGGYHSVPGGSYSDGRKDPRAYADIRKGKDDRAT